MAERWTPDDEHLLRAHYRAGREELTKLFPARSYRSVKQRAVQLGLVRVPTEAELRDRVARSESLRQIGRVYDLDQRTIRTYCRRYGIALRSQAVATSLANRNTLADGFLRPPLDAAQSWLLGILATDGNLSDGGRLRVGSVDEDIIRQCQLIAAAGTLRPDRRLGNRPLFVWSYTAQGLIERLARVGIEPRKSFTLRFPDVADIVLPAYVRGLWDGDGYWRRTDTGHLAAGFGSSSLAFIEALWEHLRPVVRSDARVYRHPSKQHWVIRIDRTRAKRLAAWLYSAPGEPCCARKHAIVSAYLIDERGGAAA